MRPLLYSLLVALAWPSWSLVSADQFVLPECCRDYPPTQSAGQWQSEWVRYEDGKLTYKSDDEQNRIPDYSYAGYKHGEAALPDVPEVARLAPQPGDNTERIQQALDEIGRRPADASGIRGALLLAPGNYEIAGTVRVNHSGVVLRGSGDGADPSRDTILQATGNRPRRRSVVVLGSGNANWRNDGPRADIVTPFVQVGSLSFEVTDAAGLSAGDEILITHPSSRAWVEAVNGGGVRSDRPWRPGQIDIVYLRTIVRIDGNRLTLDAPLYNHLDGKLAQSYVSKVAWSPVTESGVESLRIDIQTAGGDDENHAANGLDVRGAKNCWVRNVTALHFIYAGVRLEGATLVTVDNCQALDPVAQRTGARMYNFSCDRRSQLVLFKHCNATLGRHSYVSNGTSSSSGLVFYRCRATRGGGSEAGHRMWVTGVLYDNLHETERGQVLLINRGDYGTSHGWGTAHSTIWNYNSELVVQKPPTAQNYGVTVAGSFRPRFYFDGPAGIQEKQAGELVPTSLYEAQLCERLKNRQ